MPDEQKEIIAKLLNDFANTLDFIAIPSDDYDFLERVALALGRCADSIRGIAKDL